MSDWGVSIPAWCSRPNADGMISSFTLPIWLFMLIALMILLNVIVWAGIGLVTAFNVIF